MEARQDKDQRGLAKGTGNSRLSFTNECEFANQVITILEDVYDHLRMLQQIDNSKPWAILEDVERFIHDTKAYAALRNYGSGWYRCPLQIKPTHRNTGNTGKG